MTKLDQLAITVNAPSFGNAFLQNSAVYSYQLIQFEFGVNLDTHVCNPEIIYCLETGDKFIRTEDKNLNTYTLSCTALEKGLAPIVEIASGVHNDASGYYSLDE